MAIAFHGAALVALASTFMVITGKNPVHALLWLVVSLLAVAVLFFLAGAPFLAALEVIVYAGAIMVLFIFVVMMLSLGPETAEQERRWLAPRTWAAPASCAAALGALLIFVLVREDLPAAEPSRFSPKDVGTALFTTYVLVVEIAAFMLLAALVGAWHLSRSNEAEARTLP